ncbi:hypothetical protein M407DRAFT_11442 [Tulasnella calospora MUT 4182]|uniref:Uncharacterized protein n=1 Tax=Tulasnella calospora MUT 4182 TaxID=1051891 RepID=A0A0C3PWG0_9AGAM|nr:hypothetical protein M407DRAFT_11442 [Tulasnella calospora MUT 4182]
MDPVTISALAECGEIEGGQFLALMKRCNNNVVQTVFETIDEATLEAFLMQSDDFQPLLDLAIGALGAELLQIRVKQWLAKASQARAKNEVVRCSRIIKIIASHTSSASASLKQPSTSVRTSNDLAPPAGPPKVLSSAQPIAAPASSLVPKPKSTTSLPTPSLDPRSAHEVSDPKTPSSAPASPPLAPMQADVPRTAQPFPLEALPKCLFAKITPSSHSSTTGRFLGWAASATLLKP